MMKKIILICFVLVLSGAIFNTARADLILNPTDDVWIRQSEPDTNKDPGQMQVAYSNLPACVKTTYAYMRYDISAINRDLGSGTTVRLYVTIGSAFSGSISIWSTGDDWNGSDSGIGDENTLTWNNAPAVITKLDTQSTPAVNNWVEFGSEALSDFINSQRSANGGDDVVSLAVGWDSCSNLADAVNFEDSENSGGSGNAPELYPLGPTAVQVNSFHVQKTQSWFPFGLGAAVLVVGAASLLYFRLSREER